MEFTVAVIAAVNATDREARINLAPTLRYGYEFGIRAYTALGAGAMTRDAIGMSTGQQGPYMTFGVPSVPHSVVRGPGQLSTGQEDLRE
jgi:hypothetical protein